MSDAALIWSNTQGAGDLAVVSSDLQVDAGLETAVYLSLFTDAPAQPGDRLPRGVDDVRGYWGDAVPFVPNDVHGSRLWLLDRSKGEPRVLADAESFAKEALAWMVTDKVAAAVDASAVFIGPDLQPVGAFSRSIGYRLSVTIDRPKQNASTFRYDRLWAAEGAT